MLGKTHMAIGALGAAAVGPILLHTHWATLPQLLTDFKSHIQFTPQAQFIRESAWITAAIIGSLMPDFDEQHSLAARKAEKVVQITLILALIALVCLLKLTVTPVAWVVIVVLALGLLTRANLLRRIALCLIGCAALYLGIGSHIPLVSGALFAVWCGFTSFTSHRTFSHSILGFLIFWYASTVAFTQIHMISIGTALALGYMLHIVADIPSGGVALAWPIPMSTKDKWKSPRIGAHLIKTGGLVDHVSGLAAAAFTIVLLVIGKI